MALAAIAGCSGPQSALDPAGREAGHVADIFVWLMAGFAVVWLGVIALALYAPHAPEENSERVGRRLIIGGGVAFPVAVLTGVLIFGLAGLPEALAPAASGTTAIEVDASQWWWRVTYVPQAGPRVQLANEIRLPVGERLNVTLTSRDVVHSFWVPSIAGKMDLIPGRRNRIALEPTRTGTFRGTCAEFCGASHAKMGLTVVVLERAAFDAWLQAQVSPATEPVDSTARRGQQAFFANGCNTCHTVRGTIARGTAGPDLTHVASRTTIAAGTLPSESAAFRTWIARTRQIKPGVHMPAFAALPDDELAALAAYLAQLE
jgi:cytochrome c oxidase subunit 2